MENETNEPSGEQLEEPRYTRDDLVTVIEKLKKELEETGRQPTEMEAYGIRHALTHYDQAHPEEAPKPDEEPRGGETLPE